jgi:hypothetical protein
MVPGGGGAEVNDIPWIAHEIAERRRDQSKDWETSAFRRRSNQSRPDLEHPL